VRATNFLQCNSQASLEFSSVPKISRPTGKRKPKDAGRRDGLLRICYIANKLRSGEVVTASGEARARGLSRKTLVRDLDLLRSLGWKIEWDRTTQRYVLQSAPIPRII
jgi:hypothetical protein